MDTNRYALGLIYTMELELTPLVLKDREQKAVVNEQIFLDVLGLSFVDSGPIEVLIENKRLATRSQTYPIRSDYGKPLGTLQDQTNAPADSVYTESGTRHVLARGRVEDINVHIRNTSALQSKIAAVAQTGTVITK